MKFNLPAFRFHREYFLLLLPFFFVLHGFTENYSVIHLQDIMLLLFEYILATSVICFISLLLFRDWRKASLFGFCVMGFHFFFGSMHDLVKTWMPHSFLIKYLFLLPLVLVLFTLLIVYLFKTNRKFNRLTRYLNALLIVLVIIDGVQLILKTLRPATQYKSLAQGFTFCDSCNRPDIYLIVADEYAGEKELKDIFHFDNSSFLNALRNRGFFIVPESRSNYNYTPFSIASLLSMDYLQGLEGRNQSKTDRSICYRKINENNLTAFLRQEGYELKNFSVFQYGNILPPSRSSFFLSGKDLITAQTFLSRLDRDIRFNLVSRFHLESEMKRLAESELNSITTIYQKTIDEAGKINETPRFIYTHLMMPHYPYFFDSTGNMNSVNLLMEGEQGRQKEYIGYMQYSNGKFLELIDHILANSKQPPIILFMGDHGFRHFSKDVDHDYYFMNMNAIYLPQRNYSAFYNGMSLVNEFRVLLNTEFDQHLPLKKDSSIFLRE